MRTYTVQCDRPNGLPVIKHTYEGFNRRMSPPPSLVALVHCDGQYDLFAVDNEKEAVENLKEYLKDNEGGFLCAMYTLTG